MSSSLQLLDYMTSSDEVFAPAWSSPPSLKSRGIIQRAVNSLLDHLAPERGLKLNEKPNGPIEQHRTPNGCVLQAEKAALSVSWFSGAANDSSLGELRVVVWRGVVSRRGAPKRKEGATVVSEMVVHPIENASTDNVWRAGNGEQYTTPSLAAACTRLLDQQVLRES